MTGCRLADQRFPTFIMASWRSAFPQNLPYSPTFINGLAAANKTDTMTAAFHDEWAKDDRRRSKEQDEQTAKVAKWGKQVETRYLRKYGLPLPQATTRSTNQSHPSSEESSQTGEDGAWEQPQTSFVDAATGLRTTVAKDSNVSSGRHRKRLSGSYLSAATIQVC